MIIPHPALVKLPKEVSPVLRTVKCTLVLKQQSTPFKASTKISNGTGEMDGARLNDNLSDLQMIQFL